MNFRSGFFVVLITASVASAGSVLDTRRLDASIVSKTFRSLGAA